MVCATYSTHWNSCPSNRNTFISIITLLAEYCNSIVYSVEVEKCIVGSVQRASSDYMYYCMWYCSEDYGICLVIFIHSVYQVSPFSTHCKPITLLLSLTPPVFHSIWLPALACQANHSITDPAHPFPCPHLSPSFLHPSPHTHALAAGDPSGSPALPLPSPCHW